jgi:pilus assembly protein Flp/PilA
MARNERGATAVEYGLLVVLIAAVIVGLVATLGDNIAGGFTDVNETLVENGAGGDGDDT